MAFFTQTIYSKLESSFYEPIYGNYKFDTDLSDFGIKKERKVRKVNRNGSLLKLKDSSDIKSIFPMLDEFGYTFSDFFIFRSTWDINYYSETNLPDLKSSASTSQIKDSNIYRDNNNIEKDLIKLDKYNIIGRPINKNEFL